MSIFKVEIHIPEILRNSYRKVQQIVLVNVETACIHLRDETTITLTGRRTGRRYRVPGTGVMYTASKPGEPPAVRTGGLKGSIKYEMIGRQAGGIAGKVYSDIEEPPYPFFLEKGTRKMKARPFLKLTYEKEEQKIKEIIEDGLADGLR